MVNMIAALITTILLPLAAAAPASVRDYPTTKGCTATSFSSFAWTIEDFTYHASYTFSTPAHQIAGGQVAFNLTNPAIPGEKVQCSAYSTQLSDFFYGNLNYQCQGSKSESSFAFSRPSGRLDLNQTWTCTDADPKYPTTFHAQGTANLTLACKESNYENPDWQIGQIYSNRVIDCKPVTLPITPNQKSAVA
ncbi:hypothetical protein GGS20DRAFT_583937 [Poronia punctata]|nr:hypothetical protein GGS20DRAFT_583937 [Poronia punctata]